MKQFLILLKGKMELDYSPEALQKRLDEYDQWVTQINEHYVNDNRLERNGTHIIDEGHVQTDGPFLETKEIIAGFIIIQASDLNQATTIAKSSPLLKYFEMYVRPIVT